MSQRAMGSTKSASPPNTSKWNTDPFPVNAKRNRTLPQVEEYEIPPYKPRPDSFIRSLYRKFMIETILHDMAPWESAITTVSIFVVLIYAIYLWIGAAKWMAAAVYAELAF